MDSKFHQVDLDTGEVVDGFVAVLQPKRKNAFYTGWFAVSQEALMHLAKSDLGLQETKVLFALLSKLDFENYILITQKDIAEELNMKKTNVSSSIKFLVEKGILIRGPKVQRSYTYRLDATFGWKGSAKKHHEALQERMKKVGVSVISSKNDLERN